MLTSGTYTPPPAADIAARQNETESLQYIVAASIAYSKAKAWFAVRIGSLALFAIVAPIIAMINQDIDVIIGAVTGLWWITSRTLLRDGQRRYATYAAACQELFDRRLFQMPKFRRVRRPAPEAMVQITDEPTIRAVAKRRKLLNWYAINLRDSGAVAIAICHHTNTYYGNDLLTIWSRLWLGVFIAWTIILVTLTFVFDFSLQTFLLTVALPIAPIYTDIFDFANRMKRARHYRVQIAKEIETKIKKGDIDSDDLIDWQLEMYDLRLKTPLVPNWLYKMRRSANERTMKTTAQKLSDEAYSQK